MNTWFYDSQGSPIAFEDNEELFSLDGKFIGLIQNGEVYNGNYQGEIIEDLYLVNPLKKNKWGGIPTLPGIPIIPVRPSLKRRVFLPEGLEDVKTMVKGEGFY